jgi:hypothetical protein
VPSPPRLMQQQERRELQGSWSQGKWRPTKVVNLYHCLSELVSVWTLVIVKPKSLWTELYDYLSWPFMNFYVMYAWFYADWLWYVLSSFFYQICCPVFLSIMLLILCREWNSRLSQWKSQKRTFRMKGQGSIDGVRPTTQPICFRMKSWSV